MNGWWITGFADGESWFFARPLLRGYKKDRSIQVTWAIALRDDDADTLQEIRDYFNVGTITKRTSRSSVGNGQVTLNVYGVANAKVVIDHFTRYPLQSKKAKDFAIWKDIVENLEKKEHLNSDEGFIDTIKLCDDLRWGRLYERNLKQLKGVSGNCELYLDKVMKGLLTPK